MKTNPFIGSGVALITPFNEDFSVSHKEALTKEELSQFRGSKYVQSEIGDSYKKAKEYLEKKEPMSIAYHGNIVDLLEYADKNNIHIEFDIIII